MTLRTSSLIFGLLTAASGIGQTTYYVTTTGIDAADRDGRTPATAWGSLAFASERVAGGEATIELGAGTFVATRTAVLGGGVTVVGQGSNETTLTNAASFIASASAHCDWTTNADNFLISIPKGSHGVTIKDITFGSPDANPLYGAVHATQANDIELDRVTVRNFAWAGVYLLKCSRIRVRRSLFDDASYERHCSEWGGGLRTRYVKAVEIDGNTFQTTKGGGYGYKASGHEATRIHDNLFRNKITAGPNDGRPFDLESAHEFEYGLEIYDNVFNGMVSVPRQGSNATTSHATGATFDYAIRIHDNVFHGSGGVEGPRSNLVIDHNYFANTWGNNGRVYEIHGGRNAGPTVIHHNVAECSMGFVFKKNELSENVSIFNNTVFLANTTRDNFPTSFLEVSGAVDNWQVKNNVVISTDPQGREKASAFSRGSLPTTGMALARNVAYGVANVPSGVAEVDPGLALAGLRPTAYYHPAAGTSYVVDAGVDVGRGYEGAAPDLGAYEWIRAPTASPELTMTETSADAVALAWTAPRSGDDVRSHQLYRDGSLVAILAEGRTSYRISDLSPATTYAFEVWAMAADTGKSNVLSVTTAGVSTLAESDGSTHVSGVYHTGFSPNGDGVNDVLELPGGAQREPLAIRVYDRRGAEVYHSERYGNDWDGRRSGRPLAAGTYFYRTTSGGEVAYRGYVEIQY